MYVPYCTYNEPTRECYKTQSNQSKQRSTRYRANQLSNHTAVLAVQDLRPGCVHRDNVNGNLCLTEDPVGTINYMISPSKTVENNTQLWSVHPHQMQPCIYSLGFDIRGTSQRERKRDSHCTPRVFALLSALAVCSGGACTIVCDNSSELGVSGTYILEMHRTSAQDNVCLSMCLLKSRLTFLQFSTLQGLANPPRPSRSPVNIFQAR